MQSIRGGQGKSFELVGRDGDATADASKGAVGGDAIEKSGENGAGDIWPGTEWTEHVEMVFDNNRAVSG